MLSYWCLSSKRIFVGPHSWEDSSFTIQSCTFILAKIDGTAIPRNEWWYFWCATDREDINSIAFANAVLANGIKVPQDHFVQSNKVRFTWSQQGP